jgi:hypothetical protein
VYDDVAWKFADPEQMQILEQAAPVQEIWPVEIQWIYLAIKLTLCLRILRSRGPPTTHKNKSKACSIRIQESICILYTRLEKNQAGEEEEKNSKSI